MSATHPILSDNVQQLVQFPLTICSLDERSRWRMPIRSP